MVLTAQNKFIDTKPIERLFTQGEKFSDRIHFVLPPINNDVDVSGCAFAIRTVASDGSMTETILDVQHEGEQILITWNVPETVTAVPGMLQLELVGSRGTDVIIKYKMPAVYVKAAVMGDHLPPPNIIEEKLAQMNDILAQAQAKLDEVKNIAVDIIDPTLTISDKAADAKVTGDRLESLSDDITKTDNLVKGIITNISSGAIGQMLMEVINARTSSITDTEFDVLSERLKADFESVMTPLQKVIELVNSYTEETLSGSSDDTTLCINGIGSISDRTYIQRNDFKYVEVNIGGNTGIEAFRGCSELNIATVNCTKICDKAFSDCSRLGYLTIGKKVKEIGSGIIANSAFYIPKGVRVMYTGTMAEWTVITKSPEWVGDIVTVENGVVICSDGTVEV